MLSLDSIPYQINTSVSYVEKIFYNFLFDNNLEYLCEKNKKIIAKKFGLYQNTFYICGDNIILTKNA